MMAAVRQRNMVYHQYATGPGAGGGGGAGQDSAQIAHHHAILMSAAAAAAVPFYAQPAPAEVDKPIGYGAFGVVWLENFDCSFNKWHLRVHLFLQLKFHFW